MNYVVIRHKVADFERWKVGYDLHLAAREQAGLKEIKLFHHSNDTNDLVLLFQAEDVPRARAFCDSEELHAKMQELGVIGLPEILFLTD